ncbi:hypothetical protein [Vagococcus fluvialis]|uniref:hypothetical protein n=1 Tax=Vagococcus fluvialis TaxID=2738 RepID=UPI001D0B9A68|nr:hypothetical protein [Vagococcus fluvialis]UDM72756.1 hypothetical protein K5L00_14475 [Vagococcus fluvialis]UDM78312.1 hypothetical protein K5K98_14680 [Vagococcus fluvialis]UDM84031.1 hypothetical protein K5K96_14500 [Vagococcus fluvialis]
MARKREGLSGKKQKKNTSNLDDYFEELIEGANDEVVNENLSPPSNNEPIEEIKENEEKVDLSNLEEKIDNLDKLETTKEEVVTPTNVTEEHQVPEKPSVKVKGGKLKIATTKKVVKLSRESFTKLNENKKYNLQKKNNENSQQLATETKTFSVRPDLLDILADVVDGQYGMNTKIVQNALINELVRIGVLDSDSLSEMLDY